MSGPLEITGRVVGAEGVTQKLFGAAAQSHIRKVAKERVQSLGLQLLAKVKVKLSGDVLNVRTGRLRGQTNEETTVEGDTVTSSTGTNVVYGRFWELGYSGVESVAAHSRAGHLVRAHQRRVHVAPRSFLASSLDEMRDTIVKRLSEGVV